MYICSIYMYLYNDKKMIYKNNLNIYIYMLCQLFRNLLFMNLESKQQKY